MWITRVSINHPVFATMVMVALCVLGLFSYNKLGVEQMPDISFPGMYFEVQYPGASPEAVESEVIRPVEEAVNSVAGVKRIMSRSQEGQGLMNIEFGLDTKANGETGGTGKQFDWKILSKAKIEKPFFLSGGLSVADIAKIKKFKHPDYFGVDINSKFEKEPGVKDMGQVLLFKQGMK